MLLIKTALDLQKYIAKNDGTIGFVPTMGALHAGHISLIQQSKLENKITVCSIFVNPLQFNNANDLQKYPRTLASDMEKLLEAGCDIVFAPAAEDIYKNESDEELDFDIGILDTLFEGAMRPGHFKGVAVIVNKFFEMVKPTNAYFGLKDYQQCMLINKMVHDLQIPVTLHLCPTLREPDGLAMSSRNVRLTPEARKVAPKIFEALQYAKQNYRIENITTIESWCKSHLLAETLFRMEYFNIVNAETLLPVKQASEKVVALCAVFLGDVRLIDNMVLN